MTLVELMTKDINDAIRENAMAIGAGSTAFGLLQKYILLSGGYHNAEVLMNIVAHITSIGGAIVVLLTLLIKGKQAYDLFIAKKKKTDEAD
jgi:hypothetical protein